MVLLFAVASYLTLMSVAGENRFSGRLLFVFGGSHGVHLGDLFPLTAWVIATGCCLHLWRTSA